jgi:Ni/Fe-hydrogenase 1 B-type cytochrome subunit
MTEQIRRVMVWSGWLRFSHAALALATLVLMATGWLLASSPTLAAAASDIHFLAASILIAALMLRLVMGFFGKGAERFGHLLPRSSELAAIRASLLFYLTLGKAPLPNWFAHNPLWKPVYLILFVLLALSALTGWVMPEIQVVGRLYLPRVHGWLSNAIWVVTLAHLFSVVLQDIRGRAADVSGMLSGYRFFVFERDGAMKPGVKQVSVKLDDLGRP